MSKKPLIPYFSKRKEIPPSAHLGAQGTSSEIARTLSHCSTREARAVLSFTQAEQYSALPLGIIRFSDGEMLSVAVRDENDHELLNTLQFASGRRVRLISAEAESLKEAIFLAYKGDDSELMQSFMRANDASKEKIDALYAGLEFRPEHGDAARVLASLFDYAVSKEASDIHLVPLREGSCVKLRIHGELLSSPQNVCSKQIHTQMLTRLKILASLDTTNKGTPQDGSFSFPAGGRSIFARVSIMPTIHGEKAAIRLVGMQGQRSLDQLDLSPESLLILKEQLNTHRGLILFCGPTGSGKSTSMYAALEYLKYASLHIVTIEDPVELFIDGISQTNICEERGLTFEASLRSALRQDPDVILVGEIRDAQSARIAVQAAMTGHLLLSTVHARGVLEVFMRLQHLGLDTSSMAQAITLVVGQRLLPLLCDACKIIDLNASRRCGIEVSKHVGCSHCDYSGFQGRSLLSEILIVDQKLRLGLQKGMLSADSLFPLLTPENYLPIKISLDRLLRNGQISLEQYERELGAASLS